MISKSAKLLLGFIILLLAVNIVLTILQRNHTDSVLEKLDKVEQRLDTAHKAINNARYQIDTLLSRTKESAVLLQRLDIQVQDISRKYEAEQKSSRLIIENMKKQFHTDQEKLLELQKELKGFK